METLLQDLRYAIRTLRKSPGFTLVAVLTLALGIGANTAIFGVVNSVLLKPLPYADADRILTLWQSDGEQGIEDVAPANFLDWREQSRSFEAMAAIEPFSVDYVGPDGPEAIRTWLVTEGFLDILRTPALLSRTFRPDEDMEGNERVVVLGYGLWRSRFGADPEIAGRTLILDDAPATVIGVMPPEFSFPAGRELWAPKLFSERERQNRTSAYYQVIGTAAGGEHRGCRGRAERHSRAARA